MNVSKKRGRSHSGRPVNRFKKRAVVPAVLRLRAPEKKVVDAFTSLNFNTTGSFLLLNAPVAGANEYQRIGRKISMSSAQLRGYVRFAQAGTTPSNDFLRLILFYDRQPNGAAPAVADILLDVDNTGGTNTSAISSLNINNADRFKVLRDLYWSIPSASAATEQNGTTGGDKALDYKPASFRDFISLKGMETHFNAGTAGTIADITSGSLYLLALGMRASADSQWQVAVNTRVRYLDQ